MDFLEKFSAFFWTLLVVGLGYFGYLQMADRNDCTKMAMSQHRSAEEIKTICR